MHCHALVLLWSVVTFESIHGRTEWCTHGCACACFTFLHGVYMLVHGTDTIAIERHGNNVRMFPLLAVPQCSVQCTLLAVSQCRTQCTVYTAFSASLVVHLWTECRGVAFLTILANQLASNPYCATLHCTLQTSVSVNNALHNPYPWTMLNCTYNATPPLLFVLLFKKDMNFFRPITLSLYLNQVHIIQTPVQQLCVINTCKSTCHCIVLNVTGYFVLEQL